MLVVVLALLETPYAKKLPDDSSPSSPHEDNARTTDRDRRTPRFEESSLPAPQSPSANAEDHHVPPQPTYSIGQHVHSLDQSRAAQRQGSSFQAREEIAHSSLQGTSASAWTGRETYFIQRDGSMFPGSSKSENSIQFINNDAYHADAHLRGLFAGSTPQPGKPKMEGRRHGPDYTNPLFDERPDRGPHDRPSVPEAQSPAPKATALLPLRPDRSSRVKGKLMTGMKDLLGSRREGSSLPRPSSATRSRRRSSSRPASYPADPRTSHGTSIPSFLSRLPLSISRTFGRKRAERQASQHPNEHSHRSTFTRSRTDQSFERDNAERSHHSWPKPGKSSSSHTSPFKRAGSARSRSSGSRDSDELRMALRRGEEGGTRLTEENLRASHSSGDEHPADPKDPFRLKKGDRKHKPWPRLDAKK